MTDQAIKPYVIVVGVDYSETGERALHQAMAIANREKGAEPHVVSVAGANGPMLRLELPDQISIVSLSEASDQLKQYVEKQLEVFRETNETNFDRVVTHVRVGAPAHEIAQIATDLEADVVVVGTHGRRGVRRLLLGSVAEGVVRMASCPVFVVRPKDHSGGLEVPQIEPPCPRCVEARRASAGAELWCEQHRERHGRRHTYHFVNKNSEARENSSLLIR